MNRRGFLAGLVGIIAAPAIVRASSLMPVKALSGANIDAIVALLTARIDEAHRMMDHALSESIFLQSHLPPCDNALLRQASEVDRWRAGSQYLRFDGYERLTTVGEVIVING